MEHLRDLGMGNVASLLSTNINIFYSISYYILYSFDTSLHFYFY